MKAKPWSRLRIAQGFFHGQHGFQNSFSASWRVRSMSHEPWVERKAKQDLPVVQTPSLPTLHRNRPMKMQVLVTTMLGAITLASTASAQTFVHNSGNGTGNTINVGGGFGRTQIRNSGNGDFNTINARGGFGRTQIHNSGNGNHNTINIGGGFPPTAPRQNVPYHAARFSGGSFQQMSSFQRQFSAQTCSYPSFDQRPRTAVGRPVFQSSRQRTPNLSLANLPPINVNVVKNSGNGTGNTINLPGGRRSGLNLNLITDSGNGNGNTINFR